MVKASIAVRFHEKQYWERVGELIACTGYELLEPSKGLVMLKRLIGYLDDSFPIT